MSSHHHRFGIAALAAGLVCAIGQEAAGQQEPKRPATYLDETVVTASRRVEPLSQTASTVVIIDQEKIKNSSGKSLTDLLAESAVGFFSEWTAGQTSINMRGAATDGQGRDYRSGVTVLINGRRAGTANLSKMSLADVERVEIVRGPGSVIYGSQALGGVINVITRNGRNSGGSYATAQGGSWGFVDGAAYHAGSQQGINYYAGLHGGRRGDVDSAHGTSTQTMVNSDYSRYGGLGAIGYDFGENHRLDVMARSDGIYNAGMRGSQWDLDNEEDRYNQSADINYSGQLASGLMSWNLQLYAFHDVDDFRWGSERLRTGAVGFDVDNNRRVLNATGVKLTPEFHLSKDNDLLVGLDAEKSTLRSERFRALATRGPTSQISPMDNNEDNSNIGVYAEDVQRLFDDRLTLRGGLRYSYGEQSTVSTPNLPLLRASTRSFDSITYSAGAAFMATDWFKLRTGIATGFRAPTASELTSEFTAVGGAQILGNANLDPESSRQYEVGATISQGASWFDMALFQNTISDRITTRTLNANQSLFVNSTGDAVIRGIELFGNLDVAPLVGLSNIFRLFGGATYNFEMEDKGAPATSNSRKIQRMYEYQASVGAVFGTANVWDMFGLTGILRGNMYYDTEEALLIPAAEPNSTYVHRKGAFWVWNLRGNYMVMPGLNVFGAVNNIFDQNEHPIFIALNKDPFISDPVSSNGGRGNSIPGREFVVGVQWTF